MTKSSVVWVSLDPVRVTIDFYPKIIASKIENEYSNHDPNTKSCCVLGRKFFNATIHFHYNNGFYQTTPGVNLGRNGIKQPGIRSVERIQLSPHITHIEIYAKKKHGEWRITNRLNEAEKIFNIKIPRQDIVDSNEEINENYTFWRPEDLDKYENYDKYDKYVVVWQWCRGVPEHQGNLITMSDEWWIPYLQHENEIIETAYNKNKRHIDITLATDNSNRRIKFNENNCFASQLDIIKHKVRCVRRMVIPVSKLKEKLDMLNKNSLNPAIISNSIESNEIPNEYICCISQEIMNDPVKTSDNHTYDRVSIERWFQTCHTSPLTGLVLNDISLTPNTILKNHIQEFIRLKMNNSHLNKETN
jgi:hypothetical protein